MEKKIFTKSELRKIRDVAALLTKAAPKRVDVESGIFTDTAFNLWHIFKSFDGYSIYE